LGAKKGEKKQLKQKKAKRSRWYSKRMRVVGRNKSKWGEMIDTKGEEYLAG
jgi:hypothetical protein